MRSMSWCTNRAHPFHCSSPMSPSWRDAPVVEDAGVRNDIRELEVPLMTAVVLSIGSNLGDRLAHLQSVVDGLGGALRAVSSVYETDAWGGVEQGAFLNAVLTADAPNLSARDWLHRAHE